MQRLIRVAFANRTAAETGGAEESLALLIQNMPPEFAPHALLFEDGIYAERLRGLGIPVHIVPMAQRFLTTTREKPDPRGLLDAPHALASVRELLRREQIDVVHTNTVKAHLIVVPAAKSLGIASVVHLRDMVPGIGRNIVGFAAARASRRIAISRAVDRWYGIKNTRVIANPIDLSQYRRELDRRAARLSLGIPGDEPLISIVGRINRWKGHDRFLRIAKKLLERRPARFAIVGEARNRDADFLPELRELSKSLGIDEYVRFISWREDPREAYAATDVLCNCSEREPFGRTMIEAAACGVPSVAFDDGGAPDIIVDGETGFLIPAGDEDGFTAAVEKLLDPTLRERMAIAAKARANQFDSTNHALQVANVLREAIRRP